MIRSLMILAVVAILMQSCGFSKDDMAPQPVETEFTTMPDRNQPSRGK